MNTNNETKQKANSSKFPLKRGLVARKINGNDFWSYMKENKSGSFMLLTDAEHSMFRFINGYKFDAEFYGSGEIRFRCDTNYHDIFNAAIRNKNVEIAVLKKEVCECK